MKPINKPWKNHTIVTIQTHDRKLQVHLSVYYNELPYDPILLINKRLLAPLARYQTLLALPNMPHPAISNHLKGRLYIFESMQAYHKEYGKESDGYTDYDTLSSNNHWNNYVYSLQCLAPEIPALEHEFSHGLVHCLLRNDKTQLYPFFEEGIADYLAHGAQCHHITMLAREYGLNHKSRLDIQSMVNLTFASGRLVYNLGFLLIVYMAEQAPLILAEFMTALRTYKKKRIIDGTLQLFAKNNQQNFEAWILRQYVLYPECSVLESYNVSVPLKAVCSQLFQAIQRDNAKIQQFLKRHKLDNFDAFQRKIKHFKLEEVYMPILQNALVNLQFSTFRTLVNNQWLTLESMLQINTQYREYFEQFTDHYTQALKANAIAPQVLQLKKYQITPPLSSITGLFNYFYPVSSHKPTLTELYQTATCFIDLLKTEAICKQILESKINLRIAIKEITQKKSSGHTIGPVFFPKVSR